MENLLKISDEDMMRAQTEYREQAGEMLELKNSLTSTVADLKLNWQSEAGEAFFKKYDEQWIANMEKYVQVIEHMADNMTIANNEYKPVYDLVKDIMSDDLS